MARSFSLVNYSNPQIFISMIFPWHFSGMPHNNLFLTSLYWTCYSRDKSQNMRLPIYDIIIMLFVIMHGGQTVLWSSAYLSGIAKMNKLHGHTMGTPWAHHGHKYSYSMDKLSTVHIHVCGREIWGDGLSGKIDTTIFLSMHPSPLNSGAFYQAGQPQMLFCQPLMTGTKLLTVVLKYVPSFLTFRKHLTVCLIALFLQNWDSWTSTSFYSSGLLTTWQTELSALELKVLPPRPNQSSLVSLKAQC